MTDAGWDAIKGMCAAKLYAGRMCIVGSATNLAIGLSVHHCSTRKDADSPSADLTSARDTGNNDSCFFPIQIFVEIYVIANRICCVCFHRFSWSWAAPKSCSERLYSLRKRPRMLVLSFLLKSTVLTSVIVAFELIIKGSGDKCVHSCSGGMFHDFEEFSEGCGADLPLREGKQALSAAATFLLDPIPRSVSSEGERFASIASEFFCCRLCEPIPMIGLVVVLQYADSFAPVRWHFEYNPHPGPTPADCN